MKGVFHVKHNYRYPLALMARLLLWQHGEVNLTDEEVASALGLLRAKLLTAEAMLRSRRQAEVADGQPTLPGVSEDDADPPW